jgi:hypothetical protein
MDFSETHNRAEEYCPSCQPDRDPCREILTISWCGSHEPNRSGVEDDAVRVEPLFTSDAGGAANRLWCEMLHRGRTEPRCTQAADPLP